MCIQCSWTSETPRSFPRITLYRRLGQIQRHPYLDVPARVVLFHNARNSVAPGSNLTYIDSNGAILHENGADENKFESETGIGPGGGKAVITDSGNLFDSTRQNQSTVPQDSARVSLDPSNRFSRLR